MNDPLVRIYRDIEVLDTLIARVACLGSQANQSRPVSEPVRKVAIPLETYVGAFMPQGGNHVQTRNLS